MMERMMMKSRDEHDDSTLTWISLLVKLEPTSAAGGPMTILMAISAPNRLTRIRERSGGALRFGIQAIHLSLAPEVRPTHLRGES
jgi:hypothetical protein